MATTVKQQSENELYQYLSINTVEISLTRLSEQLGRDERYYWRIVRISKGDAKVPEKLKIGSVWVNTAEYDENVLVDVWVQGMNNTSVSQDIKAAKHFLDLVRKEGKL